jgi:chromosome segregation ATPase
VATAAVDTARLKDLEQQLSKAKSDADKLSKLSESTKQASVKLEKDLAAKRDELIERERELSAAKTETQTVKAALTAERKAREQADAKAIAEADALTRQIEEARRSAADSAKDKTASAALKEKRELEAKIIELEQKLLMLDKRLKVSESEKTKLLSANCDEKMRSELQGQIAGLRDSNQTMRQENENLKKQMELAVKRGQETERKLKTQLESQNEELFQVTVCTSDESIDVTVCRPKPATCNSPPLSADKPGSGERSQARAALLRSSRNLQR